MLTAIRQWVLKTMMKDQTGVMRTLPKKDLVDFNVAMTAERLARNGIDPNALKNANQVENAINQIEAPKKQKTIGEARGITSTKSAKVMDMEGKEIPPGSKIMGGKQAETEAEIAARMSKENKESAQRIREKSIAKFETDQDLTELEKAIDNASPGFAGDRKYDAQLVADNLANDRFGKEFYDLDQKLQMELYDEAYTGLSKQRFKDKPDPEDMATGGRAGFKAGSGKGILQFFKNLVKPKPKPKFDVERFRKGPINLKFLENIDKKDLAPFIRSRDTMGPGGYGMYDNFADMPAGLRAAELIKTIKGPRNEINYKAAELFLGKKLKGNESADELIQMLNRQEMRADGGRIGYADGPKLSDFVDVQASGFKSGKQQIKGAPEGITADRESINAIIKADIPISQKIDLLADFQYGKGRTRIEKDNSEIFLDEGGFKNRNVGLGFNQDGEGISGSIMHNLETGDDDFKIRFLKRFANGGRIGLKAGMTKRAFLKLMGTGAAGIAALKSGLLGFGKGAGKQVAEEVVKKSTSTPPAYFFELANKIKTLGRVTDGPQERLKIHTMPAKDGKSELMLTEDIGTGEIQIKKIGKEGDEMVTEVQTMEYTPGSSQADEATQGIPADQYDEYTEFNSRIYKDEFNDPDIVEGIKVDEIIEEVKDQAPSIKKAGGGIARMLGE